MEGSRLAGAGSASMLNGPSAALQASRESMLCGHNFSNSSPWTPKPARHIPNNCEK